MLLSMPMPVWIKRIPTLRSNSRWNEGRIGWSWLWLIILAVFSKFVQLHNMRHDMDWSSVLPFGGFFQLDIVTRNSNGDFGHVARLRGVPNEGRRETRSEVGVSVASLSRQGALYTSGRAVQ